MPTSEVWKAKIQDRMIVRDMGYDTPCWISTRAHQSNGYTKIGINDRSYMTHRVAYEAWHGDIPKGLVIDHLCRVRDCCNPDHLEAVTHRENLVRGLTLTAREVAQTHCLKGHEFTPENTYNRPDRPGRVCRTCIVERARIRRRREKLTA